MSPLLIAVALAWASAVWLAVRFLRAEERSSGLFPFAAAVLAAATALTYVEVSWRVAEHRLSTVASEITGHRVAVNCQRWSANLLDPSTHAGWVSANGGDLPSETDLRHETCKLLAAYRDDPAGAGRPEQTAVHVLTHEAMHLRGVFNEAAAECQAVQRDAVTARLLGANDSEAVALARDYYTDVYPRMRDGYRSIECVRGGELDEGLADPPW